MEGDRHEFDIQKLLPETFDIRDSELQKNSVVKFPCVPDGFQTKIRECCDDDAIRTEEERDIQHLFSQNCIQYIAARLVENIPEHLSSNKKLKRDTSADKSHNEEPDENLDQDEEVEEEDDGDEQEEDEVDSSTLAGSSSSTGTKRRRPLDDSAQPPTNLTHPLWNGLAATVRETCKDEDDHAANATCPKGMSQSRPEFLRTMATNYSNIWKAKIYLDLKRAIVRYLLRIHLRPRGEQQYRDLKKKYAESKASKVAMKRNKPRVIRKAQCRSMKKLFIQLDQAASACVPDWVDLSLVLRDPGNQQGMQSRLERVHKVLYMLKVTDKKVRDFESELKNKSNEETADAINGTPSTDDILELACGEDDLNFHGSDDLLDDEDGFAAEAAEYEEDHHIAAHSQGLLDQTGAEPMSEQMSGEEGMNKYSVSLG